MRLHRRRGSMMRLVASCLVVVACGGDGTGSLEDALAREVDLDALFEPPTNDELASLAASWRGLDFTPRGVREELTVTLDGGDTLRVLSHDIEGRRHFGVVIEPPGFHAVGSLRVVANLIGFGTEMVLDVPNDATAYDDASVTILPSFRGHVVRTGGQLFRSDGDPFDQCDGGTDDALAFIAVALAETPSARDDGLLVLGGSRGGNVAMMVGVRRGDVRGVVSVAGPTDYLQREFLDHPNLGPLYASYFVSGLLDGTGDLTDARERMLSCSPIFFAEEIPALQAHHGTADENVPFSQAERMAGRMRVLGRVPPEYELFVYEGADHELDGDLDSIAERVDRFVEERSPL